MSGSRRHSRAFRCAATATATATATSDDEDRRAAECDALRAIYGDDDVVVATVDARGTRVVEVSLWRGTWRCRATLPVGYPSRAPPDVRFVCLGERDDAARACERAAEAGVEDAWEATGRECCVFALVERARERVDALEDGGRREGDDEGDGEGDDDAAPAAMAPAGTVGTAGAEDDARRADVRSRLTSREPVVEKKSVFQAHVCVGVRDVSEVAIVMDILNESRKVRTATHNILAYRVSRNDASKSFYQDHDDDGETAAGGRLLRLLVLADARDVVVVVSRWYGGVHLGPARFHVINACARDALVALGEIHQ